MRFWNCRDRAAGHILECRVDMDGLRDHHHLLLVMPFASHRTNDQNHAHDPNGHEEKCESASSFYILQAGIADAAKPRAIAPQ
jgi:hypothetical protein